MNYSKILKETLNLTDQASIFMKSERSKFSNTTFETKSHNSFVTHVDKQTEEFLIEKLEKLIPNCGFIGEEGGEKHADKEFVWIIDPLDGTTNYIHSLSPVAISIALMHNNKPVIGVVHEIGLNEAFYSAKGEKAYMNQKEIHVSKVSTLQNSLLGTGFPYYDYDRLDKYMALMKEFMHTSHGLRRLGSAATDLAYVACGRLDGFFEYSLSPWDVAAGAFIVEQAGGKVADFSGGDNYLFGQEIIASNNLIYDALLNEVMKFMA
ncbi:MAG: inositol monophosphatase family protein [Salinivirgaceae bacterium]|nr:inositol monophosphatase family protein [Salinivirgaceae bacterium]MDD4745693.1 inositol monophosphatase family protein [Salinivirgaceae bacterium]MDY0279657.1 inositol monophosphatase family protein [Salinivirgaceae bacterium]